MDPVTTIVAAVIAGIAAGTASGATEVSKQVIVGAYGGLKAILKQRFGESSDVVDAVTRLESKPESAGYKQVLEEELEAVKADQDREVLDAAQKVLDNYRLTAPFAGTVTDITLEIGQFVGPEARAAQLADLSEFIIETSDLTELEVVKISVGQTVEIVPDALPDILLLGKVEQIGQSFKTQAGDIIYTITIRLDETDPNLRWGMTVELTFLPE